MPLSTLDPKTALIVIDLQNGIVAFPTAHSASEVVNKAAVLAEAFRRCALPVVLVTVVPRISQRTEQPRRLGDVPPEWYELAPELKPQPQDHRVVKHRFGAFTGTGLDDYLKGQGITQVVMAGISTSIGVETTARQAFEEGYNLAFATDAMTDLSAEAHANSITRIFPRLGETGSTDDVLNLLEARA